MWAHRRSWGWPLPVGEAQPEAGSTGHGDKLKVVSGPSPGHPEHGRWGEVPPEPKDDIRPLPRGAGLLVGLIKGHQCSAGPPPGDKPVQCVDPGGWGSRGTPGGHRHSSRQRGSEPPPEGPPLVQPKGGPLSRSSGIRRSGGVLRQTAPVPEDRLPLLLQG